MESDKVLQSFGFKGVIDVPHCESFRFSVHVGASDSSGDCDNFCFLQGIEYASDCSRIASCASGKQFAGYFYFVFVFGNQYQTVQCNGAFCAESHGISPISDFQGYFSGDYIL